jgi:hypothetical protein
MGCTWKNQFSASPADLLGCNGFSITVVLQSFYITEIFYRQLKHECDKRKLSGFQLSFLFLTVQ